jgi:hypothetical protein
MFVGLLLGWQGSSAAPPNNLQGVGRTCAITSKENDNEKVFIGKSEFYISSRSSRESRVVGAVHHGPPQRPPEP